MAAIHSLFRYAQHRHPEHAQDIARVLAIPLKRADRAIVTFLDENEIQALLDAPDRSTWTGRRDHALLVLAIQTGMRASELTGLRCGDVQLSTGPHIHCSGKFEFGICRLFRSAGNAESLLLLSVVSGFSVFSARAGSA